MSLLADAQECLDKAVSWMRSTQQADGSWAGYLRCNNLLWYAAGLALDGEPHDSPIVQDICNYVLSCSSNEGGIGPYPGEPRTGYDTALALPFVKWARPDSPILAPSQRYLEKTFAPIQDPAVLLLRYIFEPDSRKAILQDKGPPEIIRYLALHAIPKHPSEMWHLTQIFARQNRLPSLFQRRVIPFIMRARTFPSTWCLPQCAQSSPLTTGFDLFIMTSASLRLLALDRSPGANKLTEFAMKWRSRYIFEDGTYEWISDILVDMLFCSAANLESERQNAASAIRRIEYRSGGWIRGKEISLNIFDTSLSVLALRAAGVGADDDMLAKALAFLRESRSPIHGLWSWGYSRGMGARRRYLDTDDSGASCMALLACGEPTQSAVITTASKGLVQMQEKFGAFSTFGDDGTHRPNFCWLSNSARAVQTIQASGLSFDNEVARAVAWIKGQQLRDGSWIDGWCSRYIYGTTIALEALLKMGTVTPEHESVQRALRWLIAQQNADGGWGEDWRGSKANSTAEHTGLAVYALSLAAHSEAVPDTIIQSGLLWLINNQKPDGCWDPCYFVNFGFHTGFADTQLPNVWALHGLGCGIQALTARLKR